MSSANTVPTQLDSHRTNILLILGNSNSESNCLRVNQQPAHETSKNIMHLWGPLHTDPLDPEAQTQMNNNNELFISSHLQATKKTNYFLFARLLLTNYSVVFLIRLKFRLLRAIQEPSEQGFHKSLSQRPAKESSALF